LIYSPNFLVQYTFSYWFCFVFLLKGNMGDFLEIAWNLPKHRLQQAQTLIWITISISVIIITVVGTVFDSLGFPSSLKTFSLSESSMFLFFIVSDWILNIAAALPAIIFSSVSIIFCARVNDYCDSLEKCRKISEDAFTDHQKIRKVLDRTIIIWNYGLVPTLLFSSFQLTLFIFNAVISYDTTFTTGLLNQITSAAQQIFLISLCLIPAAEITRKSAQITRAASYLLSETLPPGNEFCILAFDIFSR
jgi:hypothetical protein